MSDLTAPWSIQAEDALRHALSVVVEVRATHPGWAEPIDLELVSGTVTFDETWSPHVQADLVCKMPPDQATLDALDPRDLVRLEVHAGYIYPGGQRDVHLLVDLGLRDRPVSRPGGTLRLSASSDELLVQDGGTSLEFLHAPMWALDEMLTARLPVALGYIPDLDTSACPSTPVTVTFSDDADLWTTFKQACDVAGAWLRDRGDRTWVASLWPTQASQPVHSMQTGPSGTVTRSEVNLGRDGWANVVEVLYVDDDAGTTVVGWAWLTGPRQGITGAGGDALPGMKRYREKRTGSAPPEQASAAAAAILRRLMRAGRATLLTGRAAWWVRPGVTVEVELPLGPVERHLVARTTFDLARAEMTVNTRQPDNTPILTGA